MARSSSPVLDAAALARLERELAAKHGAAQVARIRRGLAQVLARWRPDDGDGRALADFAAEHFVAEPAALDDTLRRLEHALEMLDGHANEVARELSRFQVLDEGPERAIDQLLAAYSPSAHVTEDLFKSRVAFVALLNFPLTTLEERLRDGRRWSRREWATARLGGRFEQRVPAAVVQEIDRASAAAERYIDSYNVRMDRLVTPHGESAGFPAGMKLISHWGLRDEIRGQYGRKGALERQRLIARVMERIVRQEIPAEVVNSDRLQWDPEANRVRAPAGGAWRTAPREKDARYDHLLRIFRAQLRADPHYPTLRTHIDRVFLRDREMPERRVRDLLESVLLSPTARSVGALVRQRLGRPLEPFDLWYTGFRPRPARSERELDEITRKRYPNARAFQDDLPRILGELGFARPVARYLAERIVVDPSRGAGHAAGAKRRDDKAHLRTRVGPRGMDYKGYNIAVHELGHNVEQVFSMSKIDHTLLEGVPSTGFTEAFAFLFQARDLELLGQRARADASAAALRVLDHFWSSFEIAGVAMLDIEIWRWMYEHPQASPAELRRAVVKLAQGVWNRYYAPVFGVRDAVLPAIYSHIIAFGLYTPDYPLGLLITFQVEEHFGLSAAPSSARGPEMRTRKLGPEMERMCLLGRLAPDVWMQQAVGQSVSSAPLLAAVEAALKTLVK
jgi:hypothetical protein